MGLDIQRLLMTWAATGAVTYGFFHVDDHYDYAPVYESCERDGGVDSHDMPCSHAQSYPVPAGKLLTIVGDVNHKVFVAVTLSTNGVVTYRASNADVTGYWQRTLEVPAQDHLTIATITVTSAEQTIKEQVQLTVSKA